MKNIKNYVYILAVSLGVFSCSTNDIIDMDEAQISDVNKVESKTIEVISDSFSSIATFSPEFGWGYQILNNGELFINQPHIPSIQGNNGFETKTNAIKTAEFIIHKLENNIFPPTISPEELDSLNVL